MSSFKCEHCGAPIIDSIKGYITGCQHYPMSGQKQEEKTRKAHCLGTAMKRIAVSGRPRKPIVEKEIRWFVLRRLSDGLYKQIKGDFGRKSTAKRYRYSRARLACRDGYRIVEADI